MNAKLFELYKEYTGPKGEFYLKNKGRNDNYQAFHAHAVFEAALVSNELPSYCAQSLDRLMRGTRFSQGLFARQPDYEHPDKRANSHDNLQGIAVLCWIMRRYKYSAEYDREILNKGYGYYWPTARQGDWKYKLQSHIMTPTAVGILKLAAGRKINCLEARAIRYSLLKGSYNLNRLRLLLLVNYQKPLPSVITDVIEEAKLRNNWKKISDYYSKHPYFEMAFTLNKGAWKL